MQVFLRRYGSTDPVDFPLWLPDGTALVAGVTSDVGSDDFQVSKDGGSPADIAGTFTDETRGHYSYAPTAAELQCKRLAFTAHDIEAVSLDSFWVIETYGHPASMHPYLGIPSYELVGAGTPTGVDATTVTLPVGANADNDAYKAVLLVEAGVGLLVSQGSYVGATRVFTFDPPPGLTFTTGALVFPLGWPAAPAVALPSVSVPAVGALTDAAADGDPTTADTLMQYVKQLVNILTGSAGIVTFPAAAAAANGVSLAEVIRQIHTEIGTAGAGLTALRAIVQSGLYADAAVWIDTVNGAAGTTSYVNGTQQNPCSTLGSALTVAGALGLRKLRLVGASAITLTGSHTGFKIISDGWATVALGGQSLTATNIQGCIVSGTCTGTPSFTDCAILAVTLPPCGMEHCTLVGPITMGSAGNFYVFDSESANIGGTALTIDFAAVGASTINLRKYTGTVSLANMTALDAATVAGEGRLEIAASSADATVRVAGHFTVVNSGTGMTFIRLANTSTEDVAIGAWDGDATTHQTQGTFGQAIGDPAADTNSLFKAVVTDATGATVGVDVVALKALLGALNDAAADGAVTSTDTIMAYVKQLINSLEGGPGLPTWPSGVAPGDGVSIAEGLRYVSERLPAALTAHGNLKVSIQQIMNSDLTGVGPYGI